MLVVSKEHVSETKCGPLIEVANVHISVQTPYKAVKYDETVEFLIVMAEHEADAPLAKPTAFGVIVYVDTRLVNKKVEVLIATHTD